MLRGSITIIRHAHACAHTRYRFISLLLTALRLSNNLKTNKKNLSNLFVINKAGFRFFSCQTLLILNMRKEIKDTNIVADSVL